MGVTSLFVSPSPAPGPLSILVSPPLELSQHSHVIFFKTEKSNPGLQGAHGRLSPKEITTIFTDLSPKLSPKNPTLPLPKASRPCSGLLMNSLMSSSRVLGLNQINPTLQSFQGFIPKFSQMQGRRKRGIPRLGLEEDVGSMGCSMFSSRDVLHPL